MENRSDIAPTGYREVQMGGFQNTQSVFNNPPANIPPIAYQNIPYAVPQAIVPTIYPPVTNPVYNPMQFYPNNPPYPQNYPNIQAYPVNQVNPNYYPNYQQYPAGIMQVNQAPNQAQNQGIRQFNHTESEAMRYSRYVRIMALLELVGIFTFLAVASFLIFGIVLCIVGYTGARRFNRCMVGGYLGFLFALMALRVIFMSLYPFVYVIIMFIVLMIYELIQIVVCFKFIRLLNMLPSFVRVELAMHIRTSQQHRFCWFA